jgi:hypothetical protein
VKEFGEPGPPVVGKFETPTPDPQKKRAHPARRKKWVSKMNFDLDPELERIQKLARELAADFATRASQHDQESISR